MTDFDYKKYSLENLSNWLNDAISSAEATPQEIYDTIKNVVQEQHDYHKDQAERVNELLQLLNGHKPISFNISSYNDFKFNTNDVISFNTCSIGDTSEYCTNSWNSFWEENYYPEEYNVREQEYYNKEDKVVKWQLPVQVDGLTGDCYIELPDDLLEAAGLKEGDTIEWCDNKNGSYTLRKVNVK